MLYDMYTVEKSLSCEINRTVLLSCDAIMHAGDGKRLLV